MHPHTVLQNQIGNILRQWQRNRGSIHSLPKRPRLRCLLENQNNKGSLQKTHWRSSTSCRKFGDSTTADHKVLNEGCESRDNHRYAVVLQDLAARWMARGMGSPRHVHNRRRRTREGPEPACVLSPLSGVAHAGREGRINVPPWYRRVGVVSTCSWTLRREDRAARKGQWSPRGITYPGMRPGNRQGWWKRSTFRWNGR